MFRTSGVEQCLVCQVDIVPHGFHQLWDLVSYSYDVFLMHDSIIFFTPTNTIVCAM